MGDCKIAIIDIDSVIYSAFHPNKKLDENGIPIREDNKFVYVEKTLEEIELSVDSCMHYVLSNSGATHYIAYVKGVGNYRYSIDENYKGNRSSESPKHWEYTKKLFIDKWGAIEVNGIEVDDACNITYKNLEGSYIAAIDKDILFLETIEGRPHYNWRKKEWVFTTKYEAELKFWTDMIVGQPGDNIKGCRKRGKVYAKKLLIGDYKNFEYNVRQTYRTSYDSMEEIVLEFNKNFGLLKILDSYEGFVIPEPIEYKKVEIDLFEL